YPIGDDRVLARLADRVVTQRDVAGVPDEDADPAVVEPGIDDRGLGRGTFCYHPTVAVLRELLFDPIAGAAFDGHRAHGPPRSIAVELRRAGLEEVDTEPPRLVAVPLDARVDGFDALDRAEVVAALVLRDHVSRAALHLYSRAPTKAVLVVRADLACGRAHEPDLAAGDDVARDHVPTAARDPDRLHVTIA